MKKIIIRLMRYILAALPHIVIVLSGMILVFLIIDSVNDAMNFINNNATKTLMTILCVVGIVESVMFVSIWNYKKNK